MVVESPIPWPDFWMGMAEYWARKSKDKSTKIGCVIVNDQHIPLANGYNGLPRRVKDLPERMERPQKYLWTSHAEENAIAQAARLGHAIEGGICYTTNEPCSRCARVLINAGIKKVIAYPSKAVMEREDFDTAGEMLREAGIDYFIRPHRYTITNGFKLDLVAHLHRQREFSQKTFGPQHFTGVLDHIRKELKEIEADPNDLEEWVDLILLSLDAAMRAGHEPGDIAAGIETKQGKNEARQWPDWRTVDPNKAIEHIKTE